MIIIIVNAFYKKAERAMGKTSKASERSKASETSKRSKINKIGGKVKKKQNGRDQRESEKVKRKAKAERE